MFTCVDPQLHPWLLAAQQGCVAETYFQKANNVNSGESQVILAKNSKEYLVYGLFYSGFSKNISTYDNSWYIKSVNFKFLRTFW